MKTLRMSRFKLLTVFLFFFWGTAYSQYPDLSVQEWKEDLHYLKGLINDKYSHLFHRITQEDFNQSIATFERSIPNLDAHEIVVGFAKLIAQFKIGHTVLPLAFNMHGDHLKTGFHLLPINF